MSKFEAKNDYGLFLRYSTNSKDFRVLNLKTKVIVETVNVVIDDDKDVFDSSNDMNSSFIYDEDDRYYLLEKQETREDAT